MRQAIAIALSLALLAWLVAGGHLQTLWTALSRVPAGVVLGAVLGLAASYAFRALRVYDEFRHTARGRFGACLRIVLIHNAMVNVVPFRGGEVTFPVLLHRTFGVPLPRAVTSLLWFRLQDAFVVAIAAIAVWPDLPLALRLVGVLLLAGSVWAVSRWARIPPSRPPEGALAGKLVKLREAFADATRDARFGWLWTFANWSVKLAAQAWLLAALLEGGLPQGAAGALGAELSAILPVQGVAGFGTYEAGAAAALLPSGIRFEQGLRAAFALHLVVIASALLAGAIALLLPSAAPASGSAAVPSASSDGGAHR